MIRSLPSYLRNFVKREFHSSYFFSNKPKEGCPARYDCLDEEERREKSIVEGIASGYKQMKEEFALCGQEIRNLFKPAPMVVPMVEDILWKFDGTLESRKKWIVTCDSDHEQGYSAAHLDFTSAGTGLFHGYLCPTAPKDGRVESSGYCNMTTVTKRKSFLRKDSYDFCGYNCLVLKVRGDGRAYMMNLLRKGFFDLTWYHAFNYVFYTTGGPYWQHIKLPFSKFFFSNKGKIEPVQRPLAVSDVTNVGITLADRIEGNFSLEIDYIAVCYDPTLFEKFAYDYVNND